MAIPPSSIHVRMATNWNLCVRRCVDEIGTGWRASPGFGRLACMRSPLMERLLNEYSENILNPLGTHFIR
jgi:hypothetical protein